MAGRLEPTEWPGEDATEFLQAALVAPAFHSVRIVNACPLRFATGRLVTGIIR
ncbi:MAG: hypothetical protein R3B97_02255 [Dehalococcoidia bacterium]